MKEYEEQFSNGPWIGNSKIIKASISKEIIVCLFWHFIKQRDKADFLSIPFLKIYSMFKTEIEFSKVSFLISLK